MELPLPDKKINKSPLHIRVLIRISYTSVKSISFEAAVKKEVLSDKLFILKFKPADENSLPLYDSHWLHFLHYQ